MKSYVKTSLLSSVLHFSAFSEVLANGAVLLFMPWLAHIIPNASGYTSLRKLTDEIVDFLEDAVKAKKKSFREGDNNDFIDVYLAEMKKNENDPKSHFHGFVGGTKRDSDHMILKLLKSQSFLNSL